MFEMPPIKQGREARVLIGGMSVQCFFGRVCVVLVLVFLFVFSAAGSTLRVW